ncbi:MAG: transposase [Saprospiraceae bacterium]|nr:transposase [Saprospiraceae bacterium]MBK9221796.1 transposase [Saprospiraceae bacterium]
MFQKIQSDSFLPDCNRGCIFRSIRFIITLKSEGRPSFESSTLLKIYLYSYLIGLRSSRRLDSECCRKIELQWLT